jgi:amidase
VDDDGVFRRYQLVTKPWQLTAVESRRLIGRKLLGVEELARSTLDRIEQRNTELNAFVNIDADRLIESARKADAMTIASSLT